MSLTCDSSETEHAHLSWEVLPRSSCAQCFQFPVQHHANISQIGCHGLDIFQPIELKMDLAVSKNE